MTREHGSRLVALGAALLAAPAGAQDLTLWSHWADQPTKIAFVEEAIRRFEEAHPDASVEVTWYQKDPLFAALKGALQAGQAPDVFYCEPAQTEYIDNGFLLPLEEHLDLADLEDWAEDEWRHDGHLYALPLEAYTVELYYNRDMLAELGVELPEGGRLDAAAFGALVEEAAAQDITPIVSGVGDRPFPGAYLTHEIILKKLGTEDYGRLLAGELSWTDPRVMEALAYVEGLVEAGAFPRGFATIKLGESHYYFHTQPGGLMFPMGSWYTSRAFSPPDQGGQPEGFPLGIMDVPALEDSECPECKTSNIGGSFCVNAESPDAELAAGLLDAMADPEMGNMWLENVLVQTGIVSDASTVSGPHADYFRLLGEVNADAEYFAGTPHVLLKGQCLETFTQVLNAAFPAGQVDAEQAAQMMDQACKASG